MLDCLFLSYGSIMSVDLQNNFENIRKAWNTQKPVETLFTHIHDCMGSSEAVCVAIGEAQNITTAYTKILVIGIFNSAFHIWDEKLESDKTWVNFKIHFAVSYRQHMQIYGETAVASGYTNAAVAQPEEYLTEALGALLILACVTATDRSLVATLTESNERLDKQLEKQANSIKEITELILKERKERSVNGECSPRRTFTFSPDNYCWSNDYKISRTHISFIYVYLKEIHKHEATKEDQMVVSQENKELLVGVTSKNNSKNFEECRNPPLLSHRETSIVDSVYTGTFFTGQLSMPQ